MICAGVPLFAEFYRDVERTHPQGRDKLKFNEALKRMLDRLATDLIEKTRAQAAASGAQSVEDIRRWPKRVAGFSPDVAAENAALKRFLLTRLYNHPSIVSDRERSVDALTQLFARYVEHPEAMPKFYAEFAQRNSTYRVVCDYISGMTDHYLLRQHADLLGTGSARSAD